jgi:hypothetical protein
LVVAIRQRLMTRDPKALDEKKGQEPRRDPLREVEVEAAKAGKGTGHFVRQQLSQSKCRDRRGLAVWQATARRHLQQLEASLARLPLTRQAIEHNSKSRPCRGGF